MIQFALRQLSEFAELLTPSLVHFIWQGAFLSLLLLIVVKLGRVQTARWRYLLSVTTLVLMGLAPIVTAVWHQSAKSPPTAVSVATVPTERLIGEPATTNSPPAANAMPTSPLSSSQPPHIGIEIYIVLVWLLGVSVLSVRLIIGFGLGLWIRGQVEPLSEEFEQRIRLLGERLGMNVRRRVFASVRVGQAVAVGFVRPLVLIPASWLTQLSPGVIEAIVAHELAHIRRWDLWVNLAQRILETLLFYHPAVWWVSERIRLEREMCCDEIAATCSDRASYARSLESVARISSHDLLFATPINGGRKMKLLNRIGYLLGIAPAAKSSNWLAVIVIAVILPLTALYAFTHSVAAKPTIGANDNAAKKAEAVVTARLQPKTVTAVEQYVGSVAAYRHIQLRALEKGYIEDVTVKAGQRVKEGDLLFRVVPVIYKAMLDAESADAKIAQLEYDSTKKLFNDKVVSGDELALREAKLAKATAKVKMAAAELEFTMLKAPFDGIVDRLQCQQGSLVLEGEVISTLTDNSQICVYFDVPEARYFDYMAEPQLRSEQQVQLVLSNGKTFDQPGKITAIETDFDSNKGTISFRADFANPSGLIRHGQRGIVKLSRPVKDALVVPQQATFEVMQKRYVYLVDQNQVAHLKEITVQMEFDDSFVIKSGLSPDDTIVVEGVRQVVDGEKLPNH